MHTSIIENVMKDTNQSEVFVKNILANLLFKDKDLDKKIKDLSGGERVKVSIAKILVSESNLLLLDEPTNSLDIASIEALEDLLKKYNGTILLVTHDKTFIDHIATDIWMIKNHKIEEYEGNYSSYLQYEKEKLKKQKNNDENDRLLLEFKLSQITSELSITKDENRKKELEEEVHAMEEYILRMDQKMTILRETHKVDLLKLYSTALFLQRIESFKTFVVDFQSKCAIYGFIPKRMIGEFKDMLKHIHGMEYQELPADILDHQEIIAPTVVHNAKIVRPFEILSKVKQTDIIDTTIAVAALYYIISIIFLGDLGVGAVLALLGLLMRKKKMGSLLLSLGVATLLGGLIYGDVFYTISLYPAIALPLSTVYKLVDGILLLIVGTYTIGAFKKMYLENSTMEKVLSMKGICGLIIVYAILVYFGCVYEAHINLPIMPFAIVIVACLVFVLAKSILKKKAV